MSEHIPGVTGDRCPGCSPASPEGPDEGLRERVAETLYRNDVKRGGMAECDRERSWPLYLADADAVLRLPLLTAERERAALADRILAARLDLSHRPPQWRDEDKGYNAGLEHAARLARNEEATAERERDEARERADRLDDLLLRVERALLQGGQTPAIRAREALTILADRAALSRTATEGQR